MISNNILISYYELRFFSIIKFILLSLKNFSISSSIKSNLIFSCLFFSRGLVILNGLGRFKKAFIFRYIIFLLIKFNFNKNYAVQNYLDYRYFKRLGLKNIVFICGSGGINQRTAINTGTENFVAVQRKKKISLTKMSLKDFSKLTGNKIDIIGIQPDEFIEQNGLIRSIGLRKPEQLFNGYTDFVQPDGYGEGFPHSLACAIVSGMKIHIKKKQFIELGLYRFELNLMKNDKWYSFYPNKKLEKSINSEDISKEYLRAILSFINKN